jgi:hypothetical protein
MARSDELERQIADLQRQADMAKQEEAGQLEPRPSINDELDKLSSEFPLLSAKLKVIIGRYFQDDGANVG